MKILLNVLPEEELKKYEKRYECVGVEKNITVDEAGFKECFKRHQELSRTASSGQFKGGLGGNGEIETKYHTATHLLNAALKKVIGPTVHQKGSNITSERMRFDFSCDHKLTDEEKRKVEELVNQWIKDSIDVTVQEMKKKEAIRRFKERNCIDAHYCAALSALATCYYNWGQSGKAKTIFEEAMRIVENTVGRNSQYERPYVPAKTGIN